jgi:hypothetical protein
MSDFSICVGPVLGFETKNYHMDEDYQKRNKFRLLAYIPAYGSLLGLVHIAGASQEKVPLASRVTHGIRVA